MMKRNMSPSRLNGMCTARSTPRPVALPIHTRILQSLHTTPQTIYLSRLPFLPRFGHLRREAHGPLANTRTTLPGEDTQGCTALRPTIRCRLRARTCCKCRDRRATRCRCGARRRIRHQARRTTTGCKARAARRPTGASSRARARSRTRRFGRRGRRRPTRTRRRLGTGPRAISRRRRRCAARRGLRATSRTTHGHRARYSALLVHGSFLFAPQCGDAVLSNHAVRPHCLNLFAHLGLLESSTILWMLL